MSATRLHPTSPTERFVAKMPAALVEQIAAEAKRRGVTRAAVVREAVYSHLGTTSTT